jgi:hypothetical protein
MAYFLQMQVKEAWSFVAMMSAACLVFIGMLHQWLVSSTNDQHSHSEPKHRVASTMIGKKTLVPLWQQDIFKNPKDDQSPNLFGESGIPSGRDEHLLSLQVKNGLVKDSYHQRSFPSLTINDQKECSEPKRIVSSGIAKTKTKGRSLRIYYASLSALLLGSSGIPIASGCAVGSPVCCANDPVNSFEAFTNNTQLKSEASSYIANPVTWRATGDPTNAVKFG